MKKNSYLLTIVIAILTITNLHAENTLFGASGAHRSSTSATTPAAQMRSTSTLMYKQSTYSFPRSRCAHAAMSCTATAAAVAQALAATRRRSPVVRHRDPP